MDGSRCVGLRWCTFVVALGRASHEPQVVVRRPISLIKGPGHLWRQRAPRFEPWELSLFCWPKVLQRMFSAGATTIYQLTGYILMVSMLGAKIYHEITTSNQLTFEVFSSKRITFGVCPIIIISGCAGLWGRTPARVELFDMFGKVPRALPRPTWSSVRSVWWVLVLQFATVQAVATTSPLGRCVGVTRGLLAGLRAHEWAAPTTWNSVLAQGPKVKARQPQLCPISVPFSHQFVMSVPEQEAAPGAVALFDRHSSTKVLTYEYLSAPNPLDARGTEWRGAGATMLQPEQGGAWPGQGSVWPVLQACGQEFWACSGPAIGSARPVSFISDGSAVFRVVWAANADAKHSHIHTNPNHLSGWQVAGQLLLTWEKRVVQANLGSKRDGTEDPAGQHLFLAIPTHGVPGSCPGNIFASPVQTPLKGTSKILRLQHPGLFQLSVKMQVVQAPIFHGIGVGLELSRQSLCPDDTPEGDVMGTRRNEPSSSDWTSQNSQWYWVTSWKESGLLRPSSQEWRAWVPHSLARAAALGVEAQDPFAIGSPSGGLKGSSGTFFSCLVQRTPISTGGLWRAMTESLFQVDGGEPVRWATMTTNEDPVLGVAGRDLFPTESPGCGLPSDRRESYVRIVQGHLCGSSHPRSHSQTQVCSRAWQGSDCVPPPSPMGKRLGSWRDKSLDRTDQPVLGCRGAVGVFITGSISTIQSAQHILCS